MAVVRGKALHYACAIPFVHLVAPSLSQLMYDREQGLGPVEVPSLSDERQLEFQWDRELVVSDRAKRALRFLQSAIDGYSALGQPIWPVVPSSLYAAFCQNRLGNLRVLVVRHSSFTSIRRKGSHV